MLGLPGPTLRDEDVRLFKDTRAPGLILYRRNFDSPAGLLRLVGSLEGALGRRLLVATDHEGGRVVMLGATRSFPTTSRSARRAKRRLRTARASWRLGSC